MKKNVYRRVQRLVCLIVFTSFQILLRILQTNSIRKPITYVLNCAYIEITMVYIGICEVQPVAWGRMFGKYFCEHNEDIQDFRVYQYRLNKKNMLFVHARVLFNRNPNVNRRRSWGELVSCLLVYS